ncbi:MAG: hypothetical protein Q3966_02980 [Neisseria sp.]|nr:hypothetical protein [Neisseria sp.]
MNQPQPTPGKARKGLVFTLSTLAASSIIAVWQMTASVVLEVGKETLKKVINPVAITAISTELKKNEFFQGMDEGRVAASLNDDMLDGAGAQPLKCRRYESAEECVARNPEQAAEEAGLGTLKRQLADFNLAYSACRDEIATNPAIDLNNDVAVYDETVKCLILEKNQGQMLDKLAKADPNLARTVKEVKNRLAAH